MSNVADLADRILLTPAQLLAALAEHEQQAAVLALAASHVEARGDWAADGSVSMRAWLRDRGRMSGRDANTLLRRGRFLNTFEAVAAAAVSRTLSSGQLGELEALLLCSRHHHLVHQLDLHLKLLPNSELHITWNDGQERTSQPRGAPPQRPKDRLKR